MTERWPSPSGADSPPLPERFERGSLVVRLWDNDDVEQMRELITDSLDHLRPWMAWAAREPLDDDARRRMFARWNRYQRSGAGAVYAVFDDGVLVGGAALHRRVGPGGLDLGYWLGRRFVGGGRATAVARLLTDEALALDGVDFVQISHEARNEASGRVPERLGYRRLPNPPAGATIWRSPSHFAT